jgi:excisionase family DNA binding protein
VSNVVPLIPRAAREATRQPAHTTAPAGQPTPISRAVYTVAEVAKLLSLSLGSTYALARTGDIPAKKMGGRWVVPKRRFHAWLDDLPEASAEDIEREAATALRNGA